MNWLQLRIQTTHEQSECLEDALLASGALSITYADAADQPILEPGVGETPLWSDIALIGLFQTGTDTRQVSQELNHQVDFELPDLQWEILEDRPWEREWLKHFKPLCFADRLWVTPQDVDLPDTFAPDQSVIYLDPGLAFGTGTHPTTALCLEWIASQDWGSRELIDYGCGSGILALAALKLGCKKTYAIDLDPQALAATRENAERNGIAPEQIATSQPDSGNTPQCPYLVANILAQPLIELRETLFNLLSRGGRICLSGITDEQAPALSALYAERFSDLEIASKDGWSRICGQKMELS